MTTNFSFAFTGIHYFLKYITIENLNCNNISQYYSFYCILDKKNVVLVSIIHL